MHNVKVESPLMLHGIKDRQTMLKTSKFQKECAVYGTILNWLLN